MDINLLEKQLDELFQFLIPPSTNFCTVCGEADLAKLTNQKRNGKTFLRNLCKKCWSHKYVKPEHKIVKSENWKKKVSQQRKANVDVEKFIYWDCRKTDRLKDRDNDLTKSFIASQIVKGCSYCKTKKGRMTLDRIDNSRGHTQDNVVPACYRCNHIRGSMPYEAWLHIAPAMLQALRENKFSGWKHGSRDLSE